ncbi:MAG: hypothetical protein WD768_19260 [Phycisphaeraceae bacterium]
MRISIMAALSLALCGLAGCGGSPNYVSRLNYTPTTNAPAFGDGMPVSVRVTDMRQKKGETRDDGREVIAIGDKGKVFLSESPASILQRHLAEAVARAGFKVEPNAEVVLDARLRALEVDAQEFTHWGLPSERASTLDAFGAIIPGPVRPTSAKTVVDVVIRKNDQRLGYAYYVERSASNKSRDQSVVDQTIGQSVSAAIDEIVKEAGKDISIAAKLPVGDQEIREKSAALTQQLSEISTLQQDMLKQQSTLAADRADLELVRAYVTSEKLQMEKDKVAIAAARALIEKGNKDLLAQQKDVQEMQAFIREQAEELAKLDKAIADRESDESKQLAAMRKEIGAKDAEVTRLANLAAARTDAQEKQLALLKEELTAKQSELIAARAKADQTLTDEEKKLNQMRDEVAKQKSALEEVQRKVAADRAALEKEQASIEQKRADVARKEREYSMANQNLDNRAKDLAQREQSTKSLNTDLSQQQVELSKREEALKQWDQQLKQKSEEKPPAALVADMKPMIAIVDPQPNNSETSNPRVTVKGVVVDDHAIVRMRFTVNGKEVLPAAEFVLADGSKGIRPVRQTAPPATPKGPKLVSSDTHVFEKYEFLASLEPGENKVVIEAWDDEDKSAREELTINYKKTAGRVFVVAIGINTYQHVPKLKYARADAEAIAAVLKSGLDIAQDNIELIVDDAASLQTIKHTLGVRLKAITAKDDMVVIYYSGHGAPEEDPQSPDLDGVEKYLLPVDANMASFYSTALPMKDVTEIFRRLPCERIVFLADTCYSGAAGGIDGGRTLAAPGKEFRAIRPERVISRLGGKGRIIMTASKGSEISQEKDALSHGVFTYYVVEGLKGKADKNRDGMITVTELYGYVSVEVAKATGNNQNPMLNKDEAVGEIVLGVVK